MQTITRPVFFAMLSFGLASACARHQATAADSADGYSYALRAESPGDGWRSAVLPREPGDRHLVRPLRFTHASEAEIQASTFSEGMTSTEKVADELLASITSDGVCRMIGDRTVAADRTVTLSFRCEKKGEVAVVRFVAAPLKGPVPGLGVMIIGLAPGSAGQALDGAFDKVVRTIEFRKL